MRASRFGQVLLAIGGIVGLAAVVGLVVGFEPAKLPAALLNIAVYKLTFAAAAGLLAAGAIVQRYARRDDQNERARGDVVDAELDRRRVLTDARHESTFSGPADKRPKVEIRERP
jgi:hypothetical protein